MEEISGAARKLEWDEDRHGELQFWIFDVLIEGVTFEERLKILGGSLEYEGHDGFLITAKIPIRWGEEYDS